MILENPSALYLLLAAALIVLLYFLRTRSRRHDVSALFLWEGLPDEPRSRAARIRRQIDPLLFLQLLVLALVAVGLAGPAMRVVRPHLNAMAIVLDGSASMRGRTEGGATRYDRAREEGLSLLDRYPTTPVALLELSRAPRVLCPLGGGRDEARRALSASQPTFLADGSEEALFGLLESQGGATRFDRVVYLSDHPLGSSLSSLEEILLPPGENRAINAFNARENADRSGCTAFIRLKNDTPSYQEVRVRVSDGSHAISLPVLLPPGAEEEYTLPFPGSRGPTFVASLEPADTFPEDDTRYFALFERLDRRVRWIGKENRYLEAALRAAGPLTLVPADDPSPVDVTVAYATSLPAKTTGNVLLVHAPLEGLIAIGDDVEPGELEVTAAGDPLLTDLDPFDFRVRSSPAVSAPKDGTTVLSLGSLPFLYRHEEESRKVVLIAPDLLETNLPLAVDFPLLVRNILHFFSHEPSQAPHAWNVVGEPVPLEKYGKPLKLAGPGGEEISLPTGADAFIPELPGIYTLTTDRGVFPLAANLAPSESAPPTERGQGDGSAPTPETRQATVLPLWPYLAGLAFLALLAEVACYRGVDLGRWR